MNLKVKPPTALARRTLYTASAPKFFDAAAVQPRNGNGRGKPEFVMSATMSLHSPTCAPGEGRNAVVRAWESQRDARVRRPRRMELDVGGYGISKSGSARGGGGTQQVGEDAYFVGTRGMGVADGVGGWKKLDKGKDRATEQSGSAIFAERLMRAAAEECDDIEPPRPSNFIGMLERRWDVYEQIHDLEDAVDVLLVLERAYAKSLKPPPPQQGSSTALLAVLSPTPHPPSHQPFFAPPPPTPFSSSSAPHPHTPAPLTSTLKIAHVGDCMAMVIRGAAVIFRSQEMWWAFNTPVQLGPNTSPADITPHTFTLPVAEGDLVILATDGLSDNLWDEDVLDEVTKWRRNPDAKVEVLSEALCSRARNVARDPKATTPFAQRANEEGKAFKGGKKDDVTVVCALVQQKSS